MKILNSFENHSFENKNLINQSNSLNSTKLIKKTSIKGNYYIYRVKNGDTLSKIANYFGVSFKKIIEVNNLVGDIIYAGQNIFIPTTNQKSLKIFPLTYAASAPKEYVTALNPLENGLIVPTSGYNWGIAHFFNAVDIAAPCGNPVFAAHSGKVVTISFQPNGYGNYLVIDSGLGYSTLYAHLLRPLVEIGAQISQGQEIAQIGATGKATGCHLHFEVRGLDNPLIK